MGNKLRLTVDSNIDQSGIFLLNYVNKKLLKISNVYYIISFIPLMDKDLTLIMKPERRISWHKMSFKEKFVYNLKSNF